MDNIKSLPLELQSLIFYYLPNPIADMIRNLNFKKELIYTRSKNFKYKKFRCNGFDEHGDICEWDSMCDYLYGDSDTDSIDLDEIDDSSNDFWYVQNEWKNEDN